MITYEQVKQAAMERGIFEQTLEFYGFVTGVKWMLGKQIYPWISVKDRLPKKINKFMSEPVLCRYTRGNKEYFHVSQYDFEFNEWPIGNVKHWMPIPPLS